MSPPRTVYLASPLSGDVERNQNYARAAMKDSLGRGEAPFVPHLLYTQVLDDTKPLEREAGMRAGTAILIQCDKLVAYIDLGVSNGMKAEMDIARAYNIRIEERRLPAAEICTDCRGSGIRGLVVCWTCKGKGEVSQ
mgnify:CR=1 FL=1